MNYLYVRGVVAVVAGMLLNFAGDWLLGAHIEIFKGIATFSFSWILDIFVLPFLVGMLVAKIYGHKGGKWLACLPPLIVRSLTYCYMYLYVFNDGHDFYFNLNLYYWGPCVILVVEASNFGGIIQEVLVGSYTRKTGQSNQLKNTIKLGEIA
jgi:peptidoglycan/LPS O-acetylase OafA/YrhL